MGIVDDIVNGTVTTEDILKHNIWVMEQFISREKNNKHPEENCKRKYCRHGNPRAIRQMETHLEFLKSELQDNPEQQKDG